MALVCSVGLAVGQPTAIHGDAIEILGDPTPGNVPYCVGHVIPTNSVTWFGSSHDCGSEVACPLTPLVSAASWAESNPIWAMDRRPLMMVQMGSAAWTSNSRAAPEWWYGHFANELLYPSQPDDIARDEHTMEEGNFESSADWVTTGDGPNGIPDQFESLIRRIKRGAHYGFRRFAMHLPAGVIFGHQTGTDASTGLPKLMGTHQSMSQFWGLPAWKQAYFRNPNGAWQQFITQYATDDPSNPANSDKYSIEVYIGGGIGETTCSIFTQDTFHGGDPQTRRVQGVVGYDSSGDPEIEYRWREYNGDNRFPFPMHPGIEGNLAAFWRQVYPWVHDATIMGTTFPDCGIRTIWLDASSENENPSVAFPERGARRWGAVEMAHNPWMTSHNIRFGGEAFPNIGANLDSLDDCAVSNMRWLGNSEIALKLENNVRVCRWTLNPTNSEVHVLDNKDWMGWAQWKEARTKGYVVSSYNVYNSGDIPGVYHSIFGEYHKRWYSLGMIQVADFNGDGIVSNTNDLDAAAANAAINAGIAYWQAHGTQLWPTVFGNGDIDGNGMIDENDRTFYNSYRNGNTPTHNPTVRYDYHNANHSF